MSAATVVRKRVVAGADDGYRELIAWFGVQNFLRFGKNVADTDSTFLRFTSLDIPRRARILHAFIDYTADSSLSGTTVNTNIRGEAADNPAAVTSAADFDSRTKTAATVAWDAIPAFTSGNVYRSPEIAAVIQEIINRPGWRRGNALNLFHEDNASSNSARRSVYSYEGLAGSAPLLTVDYETTVWGAVVTVHEDGPPFAVLAELTTVHDLDRALVLKGAGPFACSIAANDPQATSTTIREGRVVVIRSTAGAPVYVGRIEQISEDPAGRVIHLSGSSLSRLLYERYVPPEAPFETQAAGAIAQQLLSLANSRNPTGIWRSTRSQPGAPIQGGFEAGASSLGDLLDGLGDRTGDEWWVEEIAERNHVELFLRWGHRRGTDRRGSVRLKEGVDLAVSEYARDLLGAVQSVTVVGGGAAVEDRPAAVQGYDNLHPDAGSVVVQTPLSYRRAVTMGSPTLSREAVEYLPLDDDEAVLADVAKRVLEVPATAAESFRLTVNSRADWSKLRVGDVVTVEVANVHFGGVERDVRILGLQPDEYAGEMDLLVKVEADV